LLILVELLTITVENFFSYIYTVGEQTRNLITFPHVEDAIIESALRLYSSVA